MTESSRKSITEERDGRPEEQLSLSARKKVTFDSKVTTHEPVSIYEITVYLTETKKASEDERKEGCLAKSSKSKSS
ncbi:hypothetical protein RND71_019527 [Anisodus tanguticus]|uniref:Uncharacterized protein n=1 Tax=Anisodus tanguticus TaxID=243964 RepID=A0AAE1RZ80_9SOLA|nr:hypothetical protein RND71_019527 [Anisodus tanguticus]